MQAFGCETSKACKNWFSGCPRRSGVDVRLLLKLLNRARFETAELRWSTLRDAAELLDYDLERGQKAQIVCHDFLLFDQPFCARQVIKRAPWWERGGCLSAARWVAALV